MQVQCESADPIESRTPRHQWRRASPDIFPQLCAFWCHQKNWGRQMRQTCQRLKKVNMPYHDWSLWCLEVDSLHTNTCWHAFDAHIVAVRQLNQLICSCLPVSKYNVAIFSCSFSSIRPYFFHLFLILNFYNSGYTCNQRICGTNLPIFACQLQVAKPVVQKKRRSNDGVFHQFSASKSSSRISVTAKNTGTVSEVQDAWLKESTITIRRETMLKWYLPWHAGKDINLM